MEKMFCQSCGMPIDDVNVRGTEKGGSKSQDYCTYCYQDGQFTSGVTMAEMIEQCVPHMVSDEMSEDAARAMMQGFFPQLKRWATA